MKIPSLVLLAAALHALTSNSESAIAITTPGVPVLNTFDTLPDAADFSTTTGLDSAGSAGAVTSPAGLDAAINANSSVSAGTLTTQLQSSASFPTTQAALGRYNTGANVAGNTNGGFLQFRPTGSAYVVTMATLLNSTGTSLNSLTIAYNYSTDPFWTSSEDINGLRAYFSLSGAAGSWINIPGLSSTTTTTTGTLLAPEALSATLDLSATPWLAGTNFYVLWADDNGPPTAGNNTDPTLERAYFIDNLSLTGSAVPEPVAGISLLLLPMGLLMMRRRK